MNRNELLNQAVELETLLPRIMRTIFSLKTSHPTTELPLTQLRLCLTLMNGSMSLSSIADELKTSPSAATQIADRLEKIGMVERVCCPHDRRVKKLRLTDLGAAAMKERQKERIQDAEEALGNLSSERRESLMEGLRELLAAAQKSS